MRCVPPIRAHFREQGRDPSDIGIGVDRRRHGRSTARTKHSRGRSTLRRRSTARANAAHQQFAQRNDLPGPRKSCTKHFGADDWCVSVFADNAGVVTFDENFHACFKVETHHVPSAIEPYGGANTGIGGVIRDPIGTGLQSEANLQYATYSASRPPADFPPEESPAGRVASARA